MELVEVQPPMVGIPTTPGCPEQVPVATSERMLGFVIHANREFVNSSGILRPSPLSGRESGKWEFVPTTIQPSSSRSR